GEYCFLDHRVDDDVYGATGGRWMGATAPAALRAARGDGGPGRYRSIPVDRSFSGGAPVHGGTVRIHGAAVGHGDRLGLLGSVAWRPHSSGWRHRHRERLVSHLEREKQGRGAREPAHVALAPN